MNYEDKLEILDDSGDTWRVSWIRKLNPHEGFETVFNISKESILEFAEDILSRK